MQRFTSLSIQTSRLIRFAGQISVKGENYQSNRQVATTNHSSEQERLAHIQSKLYKPSTATEQTHVPDDLHGGQPLETIETAAKDPLARKAKIWSNQAPDSIHVAPMNSSVSRPISTPSTQTNPSNEFVDPMDKPAVTPAQLAEAAAASAFEPFPPNTPLASSPATDARFAPKIASVDTYSNTSSPTAHFDTVVKGETNSAAAQDALHYETSKRGKVYGGQDTSADSKKHPKENPFNTHEKIPI